MQVNGKNIKRSNPLMVYEHLKFLNNELPRPKNILLSSFQPTNFGRSQPRAILMFVEVIQSHFIYLIEFNERNHQGHPSEPRNVCKGLIE